MKPRRVAEECQYPLTPALLHFLAAGCWMGGDSGSLDVFALSAAVLHGSRSELRTAWRAHAAEVCATLPPGASAWAPLFLAGDPAATIEARMSCPAHPVSVLMPQNLDMED